MVEGIAPSMSGWEAGPRKRRRASLQRRGRKPLSHMLQLVKRRTTLSLRKNTHPDRRMT
jgi:hypothetical protein